MALKEILAHPGATPGEKLEAVRALRALTSHKAKKAEDITPSPKPPVDARVEKLMEELTQ